MKKSYPFTLDANFSTDRIADLHSEFISAKPFHHVAIDNFLSQDHARFLSDNFPKTLAEPLRKTWPWQFQQVPPPGAGVQICVVRTEFVGVFTICRKCERNRQTASRPILPRRRDPPNTSRWNPGHPHRLQHLSET